MLNEQYSYESVCRLDVYVGEGRENLLIALPPAELPASALADRRSLGVGHCWLDYYVCVCVCVCAAPRRAGGT